MVGIMIYNGWCTDGHDHDQLQPLTIVYHIVKNMINNQDEQHN